MTEHSNEDFALADRVGSAIGSLPVPRGPERPAFLDARPERRRQTPWRRELALAAAVLVIGGGLGIVGLQTLRRPVTDRPTGTPTPAVSTPPPVPAILPPTSVQFEVLVLGDDGAPLPGAAVAIGNGVWSTDQAGRAKDHVAIEPAWATTIRTSKEGYDPDVRTVTTDRPLALIRLHKLSRIPLGAAQTTTLSLNDRDGTCSDPSVLVSPVYWLSGAVTMTRVYDFDGPVLACRVITIIGATPFRVELSTANPSVGLGFMATGCRTCGPVISPGPDGQTAIGVVRELPRSPSSLSMGFADDPDPITFTIRAVAVSSEEAK